MIEIGIGELTLIDIKYKVPELSDRTKDILKLALIATIFAGGITILIHDLSGRDKIEHGVKEDNGPPFRLKIPFQGMAEIVIRNSNDDIIENHMCSKDNVFRGDSYFITEKEYSPGDCISIEEMTSRGYYMVIDNIVLPDISSGTPSYFHYYLHENRFYVPDGKDFEYREGDGGVKLVLRDPPGSEPIPYMLGVRILDKYNAEGIEPVMWTENSIRFNMYGGEAHQVEAVRENEGWVISRKR